MEFNLGQMTFIKTKEIMIVEAQIGFEVSNEGMFEDEYDFPDAVD